MEEQPGAEPPVRPTVVMWMLALCGTIVSLQQTMVVPLLPEFPVILSTSVDNASWLVTATLLTGAVSTPVVSRLADMFGKRRMILVALLVMVLGSVLGAASSNFWVVVLARALQGVGVALVPVGIAMMRDVLPASQVPLGVSLMSGTLAIGAGAGLPLSGWVSEHLDWHAIFWVTALLGLLLMVSAARVLPESQVRTGGRFDFGGSVLLTGALTSLLLAISKGGDWGWASSRTLGAAALAVTLIGLWLPLELRVPNPLVDVRTASRPAVALVNVCAVLTGFGMFANMLVTTQQLQLPATTGYGLGLSTMESGLWMAPSALVFGACAPLAAAVTNRFGAKATLLAGAASMAGCYAFRVYFSNDLFQVVTGSMLVSVGTSLAFAAMPTLIMAAVPVTETAAANGLNTLLRSLGTSTSSATVAALTAASVVVVDGIPYPSEQGLLAIFWLAAAACLLATLVTVPLFRLSEVAQEPDPTRESVLARGRVVGSDGAPVGSAVVTVVGPSGSRIDWAQVDARGEFGVAVPGSGPYLAVTSATGWAPDARVLHLGDEAERAVIELVDRPALHGVVRKRGVASDSGAVILTRREGGVVATCRADRGGRYEVRPPGPGGYVLSAVDRRSGCAKALEVHYEGGHQRMDVDVDPSRDSIERIIDLIH